MERKVVALVPARGGSVGVPGKNLADVGGKSLLARAVSSALDSSYVNECLVSSDSDEILSHALRVGAKTLVRPAELSNSSSRAEDVVEHFLAHESGATLRPSDVIVYLQPTSPFRTHEHVDAALEKLIEGKVNSVIGVKAVSEYPSKMVCLGQDGMLYPLSEANSGSDNRQDLTGFYYPNGAIYAFTVEAFHGAGGFPLEGSSPYLMGPMQSIDVDVVDDLEIARGVSQYARI